MTVTETEPRASSGVGVPLRTLILEDHAPDAELLIVELRRSGFDPQWRRVCNGPEFRACAGEAWDLILADFALPQFDALKALAVLREQGSAVPLIVVTGAVSEEVAVECIKQGAADYLLKDRLVRLGSAVRQALERRRVNEESVRAHLALQENEQRLRALIEHSSDGLLLLDASGRVLHRYNDLFTGSDGDWYGENFLEWMLPEDRPAVRDMWDRLTHGIETAEFRISNGRGVRRIEAVCNDLSDTPCVGAIVAHYRDVTERLQLEEQFRHVQKMQAVGQLAAGLGHDFNNLLTIITGHSDLLTVRGDLPKPAQRAVNEIQDACTRATKLTRQLLTFSRKEASEPVVLDANRVISDLVPLLKSLLGAECDLRLQLQDGLSLMQVDESGLEQAIMNLVVNARDAMTGSGVVTIGSSNVNEATPYSWTGPAGPLGAGVMLSVSDTGCGMDQETMARIFEPFFTTKDVGKGTGLGLSTAYAMITHASGQICVESEPGRGSTFRLLFPLAAAKHADAGSCEVERATPAPLAEAAKETLLLVDDDDQVRELTSAILESVGYHLLTARSGEEALDRWDAADRHVDLLLTDVRMPGLKGTDLARMLLSRDPKLKVLLISGYMGLDPDSENWRGARPSFLAKPFSPDALIRKVRDLLDSDKSPAQILQLGGSGQIRNLAEPSWKSGAVG